MIPFGFNQTCVKVRQLGIDRFQGAGKHLEFFATSSFN
jgi:hypothetical protein